MDGLKDYIEWLGEFDFSAKPFGDVDALILSLLSYFDLVIEQPGGQEAGKQTSKNAKAADSQKTGSRRSEALRLKDLQPQIEAGGLTLKITGGDTGTADVLRAAAASRRFGELKISNFVDRFEPEKDLQFSAVTFSAKEFSFIAFRGTDNTLVGWKEDFMIGYTQTAAQKLAFEYARDALKKYPKRRWYIGGHSKGGNLALYAACLLDEKLLERVERVYDLDGPGFAPDVIDPQLVRRAEHKVTRIIPEYCVIGRIMEVSIPDTRIIRSSADGVMQHSIASWGVDHGKLALSEMEAPKDLWINDTLAQWIDGMSREERISFIDEFFDALSAGGAESVDDLIKGKKQSLEAVYAKLKNFSPTAREALSDLQAAALENIRKRIQEIVPEVIAGTKEVIAETKKTVSETITQRVKKDQEDQQ